MTGMSAGTQLREARLARKLSLGDVTRETKIQGWVLESLEGDRLHEQMSPIYVKGFLTTYGKFLQLDPAGLVAQVPWPTAELEQEQLPPPRPPRAPMTIRLPWPLLKRASSVLAACAVVAGLVVVNPLRWLPKISLPKASTPKLASVTPVKDSIKPPEPPPIALVPTQHLELSVSANRTTWIQVRADGKLLTQQRLQRGSHEQWTASKQFELIVAKPSQVELLLNGQPISSFAIAHGGRLLITRYGVTQLPDER